MRKQVQNVKMAANERSDIVVIISPRSTAYANTDAEVTTMWLRSVLEHMSQLKAVRGHLFVNEVYDALGLARSRWGAVDGWFETEVDISFKNVGEVFEVRMFVEHDIHKLLE